MTVLSARCFAFLTLSLGLGVPLASQVDWRGQPSTPQPSARSEHIVVSTRDELRLFGGVNATGYNADTWMYRDATWQRLQPSGSPGPLGHAMGCWDLWRGSVFVFGGRSTATAAPSDRVWELRNGSWTDISTTPRPPARVDGAMVYHDFGREIVLFGGEGAGLLGDTWVYVAGRWIQRMPQTSPSARTRHAMAYGRISRETLLFGGLAGSALDDTWIWTNSRWTKITTATTPEARYDATLTYDESRQRFVLYGGTDGTRQIDSVWEFDGTDWIRRSTTKAPPSSAGMVLQFIVKDNLSVGFGGSSSPSTWIYENQAPARVRLFGTGCSNLPRKPIIVGSQPWQGENFQLTCLLFPANSVLVLHVGLSDSMWGPAMLPLDLGPFGAPGCAVYVEPLLELVLPLPQGSVTIQDRIPMDPATVGLSVFAQGWAASRAANALGVTTTAGLELKIGLK